MNMAINLSGSSQLSATGREEGLNNQRRRHEAYYIPSGDVIFQVEDSLFRVHRYFFERESAIFRDMLSLPAPTEGVPTTSTSLQTSINQREGLSDENPIHLPQVSSKEFESFLWVFYNPTFSEYGAPASTWTCILRLAHLWDFPAVRELAFKQLENEPPAMRLSLGQRFEAPPDWQARAMTDLVTRREPLSRAEGEELGLELVLKVADMRERARAGKHRQPRRYGYRTDEPEDYYFGPGAIPVHRSSRSHSPPPPIIIPTPGPPINVIHPPPMPVWIQPPSLSPDSAPASTPTSIHSIERVSRRRRVLRFLKSAFRKN